MTRAAGKLIPLRCSYCGEVWEGSPSLIGKFCALNTRRPALAPGDVRQCDPEELSRVIDWDLEVF